MPPFQNLPVKFMKKRIIRHKTSHDSDTLPDSIHPVLKRIYQHRDIHSEELIDKSLQKLLPFTQLSNINQAAQIIADCLVNKQRIIIIGDFDADGATSTTVAIKSLRMLGASFVDFLVPNRFKFGYGLTPEIVDEAEKHYTPNLIITVDNGISSIEGVKAAKNNNIKVVVTDHHLAGLELPQADAIVNPNQAGDEFQSKHMAGVGVIFYVMLALRSLLRQQNWFSDQQIAEPNFSSLLDIVALGTVADVVPLDQNNRILVNQGLKRIRAGKACPGIQALIEISNRRSENLVAGDMGFCIGPRLNAAGRLEDMSVGIHCLLAENLAEARRYATQLNNLNQERREIESQMQQDAMQTLEKLQLDEACELPLGLCLYDPGWHQGVIGILASRIKDRLHRPVIVFADNDDQEIKGSARSITHIHIRDVLDNIATQNPGLINKFGGHAMAAGLSIEKSRFQEFQEKFNAEVTRLVKPEYLDQIVLSDGELSENEFSMQVAEILRNAEPWGQAFPEPVFDGCFKVLHQRIVGEKHLKLRLKPSNSHQQLDAIAFNSIDVQDQNSPYAVGDELRAAFRLDINEFRGQKTLQLMIEYMEPAI